MFNIISISWIYWHLFTDIIWSILENVSCVLEIKVYSAAIGWNVVYKSIKSILSNVLLKASVSLFSLAVLSMGSQRLRHNWVTELNCSVHYVTDVLMSLQFSSVAESYLTLCDPLNCSPAGSSVHRISQARILEWVAISSSRGSAWSRVWTCETLLNLLHWQADSLPLSHLGNPVDCLQKYN